MIYLDTHVVPEGIGTYRERIGNASDQERAILKSLEEKSRITSKEVQALLHVKEARARRILHAMVAKRMLDRRGRGRNTYYTVTS